MTIEFRHKIKALQKMRDELEARCLELNNENIALRADNQRLRSDISKMRVKCKEK